MDEVKICRNCKSFTYGNRKLANSIVRNKATKCHQGPLAQWLERLPLSFTASYNQGGCATIYNGTVPWANSLIKFGYQQGAGQSTSLASNFASYWRS